MTGCGPPPTGPSRPANSFQRRPSPSSVSSSKAGDRSTCGAGGPDVRQNDIKTSRDSATRRDPRNHAGPQPPARAPGTQCHSDGHPEPPCPHRKPRIGDQTQRAPRQTAPDDTMRKSRGQNWDPGPAGWSGLSSRLLSPSSIERPPCGRLHQALAQTMVRTDRDAETNRSRAGIRPISAKGGSEWAAHRRRPRAAGRRATSRPR